MSNIRPYVIINGVDSRTIQGLLITSLPPISKPAQRTLTETIDGRDGDSSIKLGYSAYDKSLGIALTYGYNVDDIIAFFNSEGTIIFSNEPDKLYNFEIFEAIDFEKLIRFKTATVTIHTQPFKFSNTENPLEFTEKEFTVVNNGNTDSRPNLVITGKGLATMQINGKNALNIDFGDAGQTLLIDSEGMNAYYTNNIKAIEAEIVATGGNGTPDNPNPINGYSSANITRCGVNVWDEQWEVGNYLSDGTKGEATDCIRSKTKIKIKPNTLYYMVIGLYNAWVCYYDNNGSFLSGVTITNSSQFTTPNNAYYMAFSMWSSYGTTYNNDISINYPATDTEYHAYNGTPYLVQFGQTVYGGVYDKSGRLTIIMSQLIDLSTLTWNWQSTWEAWYSYELSAQIKGALNNDTVPNIKAEKYKTVYLNKILTKSEDNCVGCSNIESANKLIAIRNGSNSITPTGYLTIELATPIVIDVPSISVFAENGVNNVFSDTGDITVIFVNDGQDETQTGTIVTFDLDESDFNRGDLANRLVSGNYDNIRLKAGANSIKFTGSVSAVGFNKYSRWL